MNEVPLKAYVINLARSRERRAHMVEQLEKSGLSYEIVDAFDGRDLDIDDPKVVAPAFARDPRFRPGAAGCALSHLRVYRMILEACSRAALVLEDDVVLAPDIGALVGAVADVMSGAELVLLNFHVNQAARLSRHRSVQLSSSRLLAYPVELQGLTSAGAYVITGEACKKMTATVPPITAHCDDWEWFVGNGTLERVRCVFPMPVKNSPEFRTTIDHYSPDSLQWRVREAMAHLPLLSHVLARRRSWSYARRGWTGEAELV